MATKAEYSRSRSTHRESRAILREMVERQTDVIDRDYLLTTILFRGFFLVGSIVLIIAPKDAIQASVPLFLIIAMAWAYRAYVNSESNARTIRWTERFLVDFPGSFRTESDEEDDQDLVDTLIRIRTFRGTNLITLFLEPIALLFGVLTMVAMRLR